jgi:hypothetical protein
MCPTGMKSCKICRKRKPRTFLGLLVNPESMLGDLDEFFYFYEPFVAFALTIHEFVHCRLGKIMVSAKFHEILNHVCSTI